MVEASERDERLVDLEARYETLARQYAHQLEILYAIGVSSPDFTYLFDRDHRFVYVSPPLLKLWGRTLDEAVGKNFEELGYPPELVALHKRQLDEALTGKTVSGANSYVSPQGAEGHYEYTFVPVADDAGRVVTIVGTTRDVTERVRAERERAAVIERLTESEAQFRHFADAMPQLAWIARPDGFIFWYNRRWHEYTGTTPQQMEGWGWQSVHDPDELPRVLERWQASIASGQPFEMSFPLRGADGRYRWFLTRSTPVRNARGEIAQWLGTNTDIDESKRTLAERDAALAAAQEAIEVRDDFLSVASHELKTPLTSLLLRLEGLVRRRDLDREGLKGQIEQAKRIGKRLKRLIDDLLDLPRFGERQLPLDPRETNLSALVREVCGQYQEDDAVRPARIAVTANEEIIGHWDELRIGQVLTNLIDNALKYSANAPVDVDVRREGDHAVVDVTDRGIGVPADQHEKIFTRFGRAVSSDNYGGFGLGLWIARRIVEASGGRIGVAPSKVGAGSTFFFTLPLPSSADESTNQRT